MIDPLRTAAQLPCSFRGALEYVTPCRLCGSRGVTAQVYQCSLFGLVTSHDFGVTDAGHKLPVCQTCNARAIF
jgi:hypothetical protein